MGRRLPLRDCSILGFSHTHFSGTGHSDLGDVLLMPIAGEVRLEPGDPAHSPAAATARASGTTAKSRSPATTR